MKITITSLTKKRLSEAVQLVLNANLDTREEIEHHLQHLGAHYIASENDHIIGVIGWYQDNVNYANTAMGDKFPGPEAYWVGFFAIDESRRGKGVGYALLQKLESVLRKKSVHELWVSSVPETVGYYKRQGFKLVCRGKISGNPKYFLVKNLI